MNILEEIDRVFQIEIDTLYRVRECLNGSHTKAAQLMSDCSGKVVVTGMGKSGLIARKIAATMVSTGTPATYLHAADGMHGDVGIIQEGDVVLAVSKSGESEELLNVLLYVKKIGVPVISITANSGSTLATSSELVLFTPVAEEACPLDLAPTSSTTAALVVGDALAIALMTLRGFNSEHFALRHPGGRLGRQLLLTVSDTMRAGEDNPTVNVKQSVAHMLYQISSKRCGAVSVVDDDGRLLGLVTDYDIRKGLENGSDIFSMGIASIMNEKPIQTYSNELAIKAMEIMRNRPNPFLVMPVLDRESEIVVGMVHLHDLVAKGL
tara:strand:- start:14339 stop:15307 length:969 start_codon:yes stop_codon:yes gene_type:complete